MSDLTFEDEYYYLLTLLDRILLEGKSVKEVKAWIAEALHELGEDD